MRWSGFVGFEDWCCFSTVKYEAVAVLVVPILNPEF